MMIAQRLYEGVELGDEGLVGLITYMRTDSVRVSNDALTEVREYIPQQYGRAVSAGDSECVQVEAEGRAGSARGDSSDVGAASSGRDQEVPAGR